MTVRILGVVMVVDVSSQSRECLFGVGERISVGVFRLSLVSLSHDRLDVFLDRPFLLTGFANQFFVFVSLFKL